jgi:hypothetical protein
MHLKGTKKVKRNLTKVLVIGFALASILAVAGAGQDLNQMIQQKVGALKASVARNQEALRHYTWIEKTELSLKGEVKSTKIDSCRYGPDGKIQKSPLSTPPPPEKKRGLRGKIVEKKTEEMKDYMERAVSLIERYVPPAPDKLQAVVAAGKTSLSQAGPGAIQLQFKDYVKSGDALTFTVDTAAKTIRRVNVDSWLDDEADKVSLTVDFQTLPDATNYAASKTLNVAAKEVVVKIVSSNYQKLAN